VRFFVSDQDCIMTRITLAALVAATLTTSAFAHLVVLQGQSCVSQTNPTEERRCDHRCG